MLFVKSPYVMLHHPLFQLDSRRIGWAWSSQRLRNYSWGIAAVVHMVVFVVWALLLLVYMLVTQSQGGFFVDALVYDASLSIVGFMMFVMIAADILLDLVSVQAGVKSINLEMLAGRWDLLRLTSLNERGIVAAKHAGIRLRVWRFTTVIASARLATVALWFFATFAVPYLVIGENTIVEDLLYGVQEDAFSMLVGVMITVLTAVIYVLEPFWRMQSMTALGMVLSAYILNIPLATLAAMATMLAVWLLQCLIALALMFGWVLALVWCLPHSLFRIHRFFRVFCLCFWPASSPAPPSTAFMPLFRPGVCDAFVFASSNPTECLRSLRHMLEFER